MGQKGETKGSRGRKTITNMTLERDKEEIRDRTYIHWEGTRRSNGTRGRDEREERTEED